MLRSARLLAATGRAARGRCGGEGQTSAYVGPRASRVGRSSTRALIRGFLRGRLLGLSEDRNRPELARVWASALQPAPRRQVLCGQLFFFFFLFLFFFSSRFFIYCTHTLILIMASLPKQDGETSSNSLHGAGHFLYLAP